jgi:hypothetical protein
VIANLRIQVKSVEQFLDGVGKNDDQAHSSEADPFDRSHFICGRAGEERIEFYPESYCIGSIVLFSGKDLASVWFMGFGYCS